MDNEKTKNEKEEDEEKLDFSKEAENAFKKKVLQLDSENKKLKKKLRKTISLFEKSNEQTTEMKMNMNEMKNKQEKALKKVEELKKETETLKKALHIEESGKNALLKEVENLKGLLNEYQKGEKEDEGESGNGDEDDKPLDIDKDQLIDPASSSRHGVYVLLSQILHLMFWCVTVAFFIVFFSENRKVFDDANLRSVLSSVCILVLSFISLFGFLNVVVGVICSIMIFFSARTFAATLLITNAVLSLVTMGSLYFFLFLTFIMTIEMTVIGINTSFNTLYIFCHIVYFLISLTSFVWLASLIYACVKEIPVLGFNVGNIKGFMDLSVMQKAMTVLKNGGDDDDELELEDGEFEFERDDEEGDIDLS